MHKLNETKQEKKYMKIKNFFVNATCQNIKNLIIFYNFLYTEKNNLNYKILCNVYITRFKSKFRKLLM